EHGVQPFLWIKFVIAGNAHLFRHHRFVVSVLCYYFTVIIHHSGTDPPIVKCEDICPLFRYLYETAYGSEDLMFCIQFKRLLLGGAQNNGSSGQQSSYQDTKDEDEADYITIRLLHDVISFFCLPLPHNSR